MSFSQSQEFAKEIDVIILKVENPNFNSKVKPYDLSILGKTMYEWVRSTVKDYSVTDVSYNLNDDVIAIIRPYLKNAKYTLVLFSDTPLLTSSTINNMIDYIKLKKLLMLKSQRACIFDTNYLKNIEKTYTENYQTFSEEDFTSCSDMLKFHIVYEMMRNRILSYHISQGVIFENIHSVIIDGDVDIGSNTIIKNGSVIKNGTIIGENCVIGENAILDNSIIGNECNIYNSSIQKSVLEDKVEILPYCKIGKNVVIGTSTKIESFCVITDKQISPNTVIKCYTKLDKKTN